MSVSARRFVSRSGWFRGLGLLALVLGVSASGGTEVQAVSLRTKLACVNDFRAYCSAHKVGSPELRQCMNTNGARLSPKCVRALIADGEISEAEVARRAANMR
jgi:hypothetical protein